MKSLQFFGVMTAITLASSVAIAQNSGPNNETEYQTRDNGGYHVKSQSDMTTNGTDKTGDHTVDVKVDDQGRVSKSVKSKSTQDPDGLMNAKKQYNETTREQKSDGGYKEKTIHKTRDADGTNIRAETETDVKVKADGTREKTVERTKVTDPKGMMNRTKETSKTVNGRVVE